MAFVTLRRARFNPAGLALGLLALAMPLHADRLTLNNGSVLEGRIVEETPDGITFRNLRNVVMLIPPGQVARIERSEPWEFPLRLADEAAAAGRWNDAIKAYDEALATGAPAAEVAPRRQKAVDATRTEEVGQWGREIDDARKLLDQKQYDRAARSLDELLRAIPNDDPTTGTVTNLLADAHYRRSQALRDSVNYFEAESALRRAIELQPGNPRFYFELGELNSRDSTTRAAAIQSYRKGLEVAGNSLDPASMLAALYKIGTLYQQAGDHANAIRSLRSVHRAQPNYKAGLGDSLVQSMAALARENETKNRPLAVQSLRQALEIKPGDGALRFELGRLLLEGGDLEAAREQLELLASKDPGRPRVNELLGLTLERAGRTADARDAFEAELARNPNSVTALVELGELELTLGSRDRAAELFGKARALDRTNLRVTLGLARVERERKRPAEARRLAKEVLDASPENLDAHLEMGRAWRDDGRYTEAQEHYAKVVSILEGRPEDSDAWRRQMADSLVAQGEVRLLTTGPGTAQRDFNRALEVLPEYALAYFNIGQAYSKMFVSSKQLDDLKKAEENILKARELEAQNPEYAIGLGILYHQVMAAADEANRAEYLKKAVANYEDYIAKGGAEVELVRGWIAECGG